MIDLLLLIVTGAAAAWAAFGCRRVLAAGAAESRGDLERSRRLARSGGKTAAAGALAWAVLTAILAVRAGAAGAGTEAAVWRFAPALPALAAGGWALLAGLSGKPRPTGWFAAAAWAAAAGLFVVSLAR